MASARRKRQVGVCLLLMVALQIYSAGAWSHDGRRRVRPAPVHRADGRDGDRILALVNVGPASRR
jgi:hypothetical protein